MSLLLDALKKAADDKHKLSRGDYAGSKAGTRDMQSVNSSVRDEIRTITEELGLDHVEQQGSSPEILSLHENEDLAELALDIDGNHSSTSAEIIESVAINRDAGQEKPEELNMDINVNDNGSVKTADNKKFQISDDALLMLVDKTNRDVNKQKIIFVISLFITSLVILIAGGIYYYLDAQSEIAAIERKHQTAIQSMQSKTSKEKVPENREIIRTLVSDAKLDEKVKVARQHIANEKNSADKKHLQVKSKQSSKSKIAKAIGSDISIIKSSKVDPLSKKLDDAWLVYENGNYQEAKKLYMGVLKAESGNRDALLGLGAIAVVEQDSTSARNIYSILLKKNPDDPIAAAALANIYSEKSFHESGEEYLLSMLRKNPGAPDLNFSLANIYAQQNKWKSAQEYYFNAWKYDNNNADYTYNLAVSMDQLSKRQQALSFYRESLVKAANKQVSFSREAVEKRIQELSGL